MEEGAVELELMFISDHQSAEVAEPREGTLHLPATPVAAQFATVLRGRSPAPPFVRCDQIDAPRGQSFPEGIAVGGPVVDQPLDALLPVRFLERRFEQLAVVRRGRSQVLSQRKTLAVDHHQPLCAFPAPRRPHCSAPFFAGAKLASAKLSLQSSRPCSSNSAKKVRQISSQSPCSSHCASRRQQVLGLGYSGGNSRHGAPVRRIHSRPSSTRRLSHQGRPPFGWGGGGGSRGSIFAHCSSVSNTRLRAIGITSGPLL